MTCPIHFKISRKETMVLFSSLQITTGGFATEEKAKEVETFFADNPWPMADRIVKQNCEAIRLNAKWLQRDKDAVKEWLASQ